MKPALTLCTRYSAKGASSRLRFLNYVPYLEKAGYCVRTDAFFDDAYLERLYGGGGKSRWSALKALGGRMIRGIFFPERLVVEYELFPFVPFFWEFLYLRRRRYVLNFDDNVWEKYANHPKLRDKFDQLILMADGVIAANDFLCEKIRPLNPDVIKIPTAIDLERYRRERSPKAEPLTAVWIGTPVTCQYLRDFAPILRQMNREIPFRLRAIGADPALQIDGVDLEVVPWSGEREIAEVSSAHFGIMPLTDDLFSRGKSAYKIIQYFGCGLPAIASPVGENKSVITPDCGILAETAEDWCRALREMADPVRRAELAAGAERRSEAFSLQQCGAEMAAFLREKLG